METADPDFKVDACFELAAVNKDPDQTEGRSLFNSFCRESSDWGFSELVCAPPKPLATEQPTPETPLF